VWQFLGYRKALFWYDLVWQDCEKLKRDLRGRAVAQQLIRSAGSISANVEGGHGRRAIAFILISCPFVILSDRDCPRHGCGYGKQRNWFFTNVIKR